MDSCAPANRGFRPAVGRNMIWLNDDARPLPGTLDDAVRQIDSADPQVAFLAMFHRYASQKISPITLTIMVASTACAMFAARSTPISPSDAGRFIATSAISTNDSISMPPIPIFH